MGIKLGILCGGKSGEHEVSLRSALGIYHAAERPRLEPFLVAISKTGCWYGGSAEAVIENPEDPARIKLADNLPELQPVSSGGGRCLLVDKNTRNVVAELDAVFPIVHGTDGEDGALQGMLRMLDVPFVGSDILGSAVGMDKDVMKRLFEHAGLPVAPWATYRSYDQAKGNFAALSARWGLPLYVKPVAMGSSVGVSRVSSEEEFQVALKEAFLYDNKVLVEQAVNGREVELAVLGSSGNPATPPEVSVPGEIKPTDGFYSYAAKYLDPDGAELVIPAPMKAKAEKNVQTLASKAFQVLDCEGLARVDFFLKEEDTFIINEINTLPGFTPISMYPKLWEASGLPYGQLILRLVELALTRHEIRQGLKRNFEV